MRSDSFFKKSEFYILYYFGITIIGGMLAYFVGAGKYNSIPLTYLFLGPVSLTVMTYKNIDISISRLKGLDKEVFLSYANTWGISHAVKLNAINMLLYSGKIHRLSDKKLNRIVSFTRASIITTFLSLPSLIAIVVVAYKF